MLCVLNSLHTIGMCQIQKIIYTWAPEKLMNEKLQGKYLSSWERTMYGVYLFKGEQQQHKQVCHTGEQKTGHVTWTLHPQTPSDRNWQLQNWENHNSECREQTRKEMTCFCTSLWVLTWPKPCASLCAHPQTTWVLCARPHSLRNPLFLLSTPGTLPRPDNRTASAKMLSQKQVR